jgi:uncharacterized protein
MARSATLLAAIAFIAPLSVHGQSSVAPIIDMHLHAEHADNNGPPPVFICAPFSYWPSWDPKTGGEAYGERVTKHPPCAHPLKSAVTDEELMQRTLEILKTHNVIGLASGPPESIAKWKKSGRERIMPATDFDPSTGKPSVDELRQMVKSNQIIAIAEVGQQYDGVAANDPRMEPYYALAEELDVPVGIHMGPGPPGVGYFASPGYRMRLSSLLLLEDVLARHPKLRVWAMHAGWPLGDDAIAALYAHPQLYVDVGVISYAFPRKEFYAYLQRLIDAGFEDRIMFGSDQMVWPDALTAAIETIQNAPSLTSDQKRDIFYRNACRFLRLTPSPD